MTSRQLKFENPGRVAEIDIDKALERAGLEDGHVVVDYGAGTGLFSVAAAKATRGKVHALDMDPEMLALIQSKVEAHKLTNLAVVDVKPNQVPMEDRAVDLFMLITVLHEIDEVEDFVGEVNRVLKPGGRVLVIDFYKKASPVGPPMSHRVSAYQAARHFFRQDINLEGQYDLGENLYLLILKK